MSYLGCPECGSQSFTILEISGWQEKASFAQQDDGNRYCIEAGSVHIESTEDEPLQCNECGAVASKQELVTIDE